ncbi:MAG: CehA/McbA family metallohydrolase [Rudaea sp.]|nr:CehA/McbA family metallohydrolase [Rudaea sp.]MBR0345516.1 CehA/McbA family metallohydrolase [Rudaea sp.]
MRGHSDRVNDKVKFYTFLLFALFASVVHAEGGDKPDLTLTGKLSGKDNQTYKLVPFDVPAGVDRITVDFAYTGREEKTTIDLGLLGPGGFKNNAFRGWSGGNKSRYTVSATDATPSYVPGPITPGRWNLLLGIPNIRENAHAEFTAKVYFSRNGKIPDLLDAPLRAESGWYRGDLHMHGAHSDGSCTPQSGKGKVPCPLFLSAQTAAERGLDFIALSDHNTVTQANAVRELQPYFDRLLLLPGRELTTFTGHANLLGTWVPLDFRVGSAEVPDWNALLRNAAKLGGFVSINHPIRLSGEVCMGCGWTAEPEVDMRLVQGIEVVNGNDADTLISGIPFWQARLDKGFRLTAVGGSDDHNAKQWGESRGHVGIGTPTTVVHAANLSQRAVLDALRAGHVFVDVFGSKDKHLEFTAKIGNVDAEMGDVIAVAQNAKVDFSVKTANAAGGSVEILIDGKLANVIDQPKIATAAQTFAFTWSGDGQRHWLRANVRGADGKLVLVGNPVYVNFNTVSAVH